MRTLLLLALLVFGTQEHLAPQPVPLTDVERLRTENLNLRATILLRQQQDWLRDQAQLKADIEAARPQWTWDAETGKFSAREPPK